MAAAATTTGVKSATVLIPGEEHYKGWEPWFLCPDQLNWLMSQPEDLPLLVAWIRAIAADQDSLDDQHFHVRGLGKIVRRTMDECVRHHTVCYPMMILIILVYLHCTPGAQARLPEKDRLFMLDFKLALGEWLKSRTPEGFKYSAVPGPNLSTDTKRASTTCFVAELRDAYAYKWSL